MSSSNGNLRNPLGQFTPGWTPATYSHGKSRTPEHYAWKGMWARTTNKNHPDWRYYGGRGICVCERWKSFAVFLEDMGSRPSPGHTLDRYPDVNGNYEPGNCRWATRKEQNNNKRNNLVVTLGGVTQTLSEWCEERLINVSTAWVRIRKGVDPAMALDPNYSETCGSKKVVGADIPYHGVSHNGARFIAYIGSNRKRIHLGTFDTMQLAALAYNEAAIKYHGPNAKLNQVPT